MKTINYNILKIVLKMKTINLFHTLYKIYQQHTKVIKLICMTVELCHYAINKIARVFRKRLAHIGEN